jgi:acyl-CoA thioester hydrolase
MNDISNYKHKLKINVRFADLDAMQHVNNAAYLTYLEEARIDYFNSLFHRNKERLDFEAVVARIEIDYLRPVVLGDEIEVYTRISELGHKSVNVEHIIAINKNSGIIKAATSVTKLVYYDYKSHTTMQIPEEAKKIISEFEGITI